MGVSQHGRYAALSHICKVKQFFRGGPGLIVGRLKIIYEVIMPFQLFSPFWCVF